MNIAQSLQERRQKIAENIASQFEKSVENKEVSKQNEHVEIYTREGLEQYQTDLTKAFQDNLIDASEFNKGMRNIANLEKKTITDKNGHQKTVYTRHADNGDKHEFSEGHKVVFEDKGIKKVGHITKLKHHEVYDKFGTAHIKDDKGNTYSKSLRGIEHHEEGKELEQTAKPATSSPDTSEDDRGLPRLNTQEEMKPEELKSEIKKHAANHDNVKQGTKDQFGVQMKRGQRVLMQHPQSVNGYKHDLVHVVGHDKKTGNLMGVHPSTKELHKIDPSKAIVQHDFDASGHDEPDSDVPHGVGSEVWLHDGGKLRRGKVTALKGSMRKIRLDGLKTTTTTHMNNLSKEKPQTHEESQKELRDSIENEENEKATNRQISNLKGSGKLGTTRTNTESKPIPTGPGYVGETTSGLRVSAKRKADDYYYNGFTAQDHKEAAQFHSAHAVKAMMNNYPKRANRHSETAQGHYDMAEKLAKKPSKNN